MFSLKGSKWEKSLILYNMVICKFFFFIWFWWVFQIIPYEKATKNSTSFKENLGQNDHLYCHIMVCPALYCVQNFTVSTTILCPTHYCVLQNTVSTLTQRIFCSPFTFQSAAVVSYCACEVSPFLHETELFTSSPPKLLSILEPSGGTKRECLIL